MNRSPISRNLGLVPMDICRCPTTLFSSCAISVIVFSHIGGPTFNPLTVVWGHTPPKGLLRQASVHRNQSRFIGGTVESNPDSPPIFENNWLCFRRGFQVLHQLST